MPIGLESWVLALTAERGYGRIAVPDGRAIVAGRTVVEPFGDDYPTLDHERFLDAKIALVHLARTGHLLALDRGVFVLTEIGEQRAALETGTVSLAAFPRF
jgi:hypothetical protein